MADRTCIVTGASAGIGFETARRLVERGDRVGLVCRNAKRAERARDRLRERVAGARVDLFHADVSSLKSIRDVARDIRGQYAAVDLLVNNAGAVFAKRTLSDDGVEMHLATNFLGHFVLTALLLDRLLASDPGPGRVVNMGSVLQRVARWPRGRIDFPHLYHLVPAYGRSKLAIVASTLHLARRSASIPVEFRCVDPGLTRTDIELGAGPVQQAVGRWFRPLARDVSVGAEAVLCAATDAANDGIYSVRGKPALPGNRARRAETADSIVSWACAWLTEPERRRFESLLSSRDGR